MYTPAKMVTNSITLPDGGRSQHNQGSFTMMNCGSGWMDGGMGGVPLDLARNRNIGGGTGVSTDKQGRSPEKNSINLTVHLLK